MSLKLRSEQHARDRFAHNMQLLKLELAMNSPARSIAVLVELLDLLIEQTGGNLFTAEMRGDLAEVKRRIAARKCRQQVAS